MRSVGCLAILATVFATSLVGQEKADEASLKTVNFDGLRNLVRENRGKVVLLDFWFNG